MIRALEAFFKMLESIAEWLAEFPGVALLIILILTLVLLIR